MNECFKDSDSSVAEILAGAIPAPEWLRTIRLADVCGISVRLRHACRDWSVLEFLKLGYDRRERLANYGKKTEAEFQALVRKLLANSEWTEISPETVTDTRIELRNIASVPTFESLLSDEVLLNRTTVARSVEWLNDRIEKTDESTRIAELASCLDLAWPVTGDVCDLNVGDTLRLLPDRIFDRQNGGGLGRMKRRTALLCLWALAERRTDLKWGPNSQILDHPRFKQLTPRQHAILHRRILVPEPLTLEALALEFGVTRERIRQEEALILKGVGDSGLRDRLESIACAISSKLQNWVGDRVYFLDAEVAGFSEVLGVDEQLSIRVCSGGLLKDWLKATFLGIGRGFFLQPKRIWEGIEENVGTFGPVSRPTSIDYFVGRFGIERRQIEAYFILTRRGDICGEFVIPSRDGKAVCKRAVLWYRQLAGAGKLGFYFTDVFHDYAVSSREARLIKSAVYQAASLFAHTPTAFVCLGDSDGLPGALAVVDEEMGSTEPVPVSASCSEPDSSVADRVYRYVESRWPVDSGNDGFSKYSQGNENCHDDVREGSLAAYFSMDPRLIRLAPGLFAPEGYRGGERVAERVEKAYKMALDETAIRSFLFGRWSESNCTSLFPLWDEGYEAHIIDRLSSRCDEDILWESCAAVCSPNRFCTPSADLRLRARSVTAKFRLRPSWVDDRSFAIPTPSEVLVVAGCAIDSGRISWLKANQVLGASQVAEEKGLNAVVLLSALGVLAPISKWWMAISVREDARANFAKLRGIVRSSDEDIWNDPRLRDALAGQTGDRIGVRDETLNGILASCIRGHKCEPR